MTLNYKIEGQGEPVVLLHPVGIDLASWDAVAAVLAKSFRVIRVDLRGHGGSPAVEPGMSLADFAADVDRLMGKLGIASAAVVGLSFGGMVAQTLALEYPSRVSRLVAAGCPCTLPEAGRIALAARGRAAVEKGMESQIAETLERWFTPAFVAAGGAETIRQKLLTTDPAAWNGAWNAISRLDTAPRLHEIKVPTLAIAGALDPASPPAALTEIAKRIPGARLIVLPDTPHIMQVERPDLMAPAIERFLKGEAVGEAVA